MTKSRKRLAVRILTRILIAVGGLATACWAELPVDPLLHEPPSNLPPRGIVVPGPERPGTTGTNDAAQPVEPPPPPQRQFSNAMNHWKLVRPQRLTEDSLLLRNADVVQGRFVGLDATVLGWEMPEVAGLVRFRRDGLNSLLLRGREEAAVPAGRWVVRLSTGNLLQGQSLVVDERQVILESSYAGRLSFPREMVSQVYHDPDAGKSAFRSLQNLEDWSQVQTGQGELPGQQFFRELDLPDAFLVEFELAASQQYVQIHLPLSSPRLLYAEPHVNVQIHGNNLAAQPIGENVFFGGGQSFQLKSNPTGRWQVAIACSRASGRVVVYVDGKQVQALELGPLLNPQAKGMAIFGGGNPPMVMPIRSLVLSRLGEELVLPRAKPEQDLLRLANGDAMVGRLLSLDASKAVFEGPLGRLELPVERFVAATFASSNAALPRRREADVTLQLADGGNLTAELKEFAPEALSLSSDMFGQIKLARSAVRGLQFGLYLPAPKAASFNPYDPYQQQFRENEPGKIRLTSGLVLGGKLTGLANGLVGWQHPHATAPIGFVQTNVTFASPVPSTATTNLPPLASTVQLTNGDSFRGELASLDGQQLQVRTMYTAALSIPRRYISALFPNLAADGVLDAGPIERWLVAGRGNRGQQGLVQHVRNDKLPDRVCLQLELVGQPGPWSVIGWLFGSSDGRNVEQVRSGYGIQLQDTTIILYEVSQDGQYHQPTQVNVPNLTRSGQVRLTWLADRAKKEAFLLVDGKLVAQRRNIKAAISGSMVHLTVQNQNLCRVRAVALQEWKGRAEDLLAAPPAGDLVRLHDWTVLGGPVEALREGQAFLPRGQSVSLGRVASIHLDTANQARARRTKTDVRITLVNGDILTLASPLIDQRGLVGTAEGLGTVILDPAAIRRLHFQPYEPPPKVDPNRQRGVYGGMFFGN